MTGSETIFGYESSTRPSPLTTSRLVAEWIRWASVAVALDVVPFALMWATSHHWINAAPLRGRPTFLIGGLLGGIALVVVARLLRLAVRSHGVARACYAFLAFINFKAGLFACAMMAIVFRL